jgi:lysophospholipase L1-like esterase
MMSEPFKKLVAIGDSITAGASATKRENSWVDLLADMIEKSQGGRFEYFNAGISGNLISPLSRAYLHADSGRPAGIERIDRDVIRHEPDLVTIGYGLNDIRCGTPEDVFFSELTKIIDKIKNSTRSIIVLLNIFYIIAYDRYGEEWSHANTEKTLCMNKKIKLFAKEHDLLYADVYEAQAGIDWSVDNDGIHPNDLGHRLIANSIFELLAHNCSCLSKKAFEDSKDYFRWADTYEMVLRTFEDL